MSAPWGPESLSFPLAYGVREREAARSGSRFSLSHPLSLLHSILSVLAWLKSFADARSLPYTQDAVGNLVIRRPGTGGGAAAPPVILQGHVDMVTEKNADKTHDFSADPLTLVLGSDGWLRADGTTLGADNGIGVAAAVRVNWRRRGGGGGGGACGARRRGPPQPRAPPLLSVHSWCSHM